MTVLFSALRRRVAVFPACLRWSVVAEFEAAQGSANRPVVEPGQLWTDRDFTRSVALPSVDPSAVLWLRPHVRTATYRQRPSPALHLIRRRRPPIRATALLDPWDQRPSNVVGRMDKVQGDPSSSKKIKEGKEG